MGKQFNARRDSQNWRMRKKTRRKWLETKIKKSN